jgi:hypothetical protein
MTFASTDPADWADPGAQAVRLVRQMLQAVHTAIPVKVLSCTNNGGVAAIGRVTVIPMIEMVSDLGQASTRAKLVDLPYMRVQAGANAVIMDPQEGDIGIAVFSEKDISGMLEAQGAAPPGSARVFDMADGVYLYSIVGAAPTQFVQFSADGIAITSPTKVTIQAPEVEITAPDVKVTASSKITFLTPSFMLNSIDLVTHRHNGVIPGGGTSGGPV